jgi:hypothetical protein
MARQLAIHRIKDYVKQRALFDSKRELRQASAIRRSSDHHRSYNDGKWNHSCL